MKIGIIGCGNMGSAILKGIIAKGVAARRDVFVSDTIPRKAKACRVKTVATRDLARKADVIILAVKPQDSAALLRSIKDRLSPKTLIVSIMAGVTTRKLAGQLRAGTAIVRVMPNMAAAAGQAVSGISFNRHVSARQKAMVKKIFGAVGTVIEIPEAKQDALTAVTGSGPAYFFYFVEAVTAAAVRLGFTRKEAALLAVQTMIGSAGILSQGGDASKLRAHVTSKGGTTEQAIKVFDKRKMKQIVSEALRAAAKRSRELSDAT